MVPLAIKNFFQKIPWHNVLVLSLLICTILSAIVAFGLAGHYYLVRQNLINTVKAQAQQETIRASKQVDDFLRQTLPPTVNSLADDISSGKVLKDEIKERIKQKAANVTGIGVAFAPYAYDKNIKLYAPYYVEKLGIQKEEQLEGFYDYTQPQYKRYNQPMQYGPSYLEPFFDPASESIVAEYGAPYYDKNKNKMGVAFANHSTDHMQYVIQQVNLGSKGYAFIISRQGVFIAHPIREYTTQQKTIFEVARDMKNPQLEAMARQAIQGKQGYIDHESTATGQQSWMFFEPIPATGWSLVGVFIKDELDLNTNDLKRKRIQIALSLILFLIFLSLLIVRVDRATIFSLWASSLLVSLWLLCGIIYMWYSAHAISSYKLETEDAIIIQDRTTLTRFLENAQQSANAAQNALLTKDDQKTQSAEDHSSKPPQPTNSDVPANLAKQPLPSSTSQVHQHIDATSHSHGSTLQEEKPTARHIPGLSDIDQSLETITKNIRAAAALLTSLPEKEISGESPETKEILLKKPKLVVSGPAKFIKQTPQENVQPPTANQAAVPHQEPQTSTPPAQAAHGGHGGHGAHGSAPSLTSQKNVPTGIYIYNLEFKGINAIKFIGQVWQRFMRGIQDGIKRGIVFPLADAPKITEAFKTQENGTDVIGWNVQGEISQQFDYTTYPFDTKLVKIQMAPSDFDQGVVLAADLDSYKVINPSALPGIDPAARLNEWRIARSFFSYKYTRYLTNFGFYLSGPFGTIDRSTKSATPALYFNITLQRHIISSLILDLFPIIIIFLILFMLLFLMSHALIDKVYYIIGTTASLFFTVILAHIRFKSSIPIQQIVFFEYFYFILQFLIIIVTVISILYYLGVESFWIRYKNLLIPQVLFWPLVTLSVLILSLIYFY